MNIYEYIYQCILIKGLIYIWHQSEDLLLALFYSLRVEEIFALMPDVYSLRIELLIRDIRFDARYKSIP